MISVRYGPTPPLKSGHWHKKILDRLQILIRLEAQAAPDAVVSESPDVQNPQNKKPISKPALHTPDVQDPQNKQPMSEPAFDSPDVQDPQNKRPMSEQVRAQHSTVQSALV